MIEAVDKGGPSLLRAVALISFVLLAYQLALMRILSYVLWYHFASMIIGVALLGFGGAGTAFSLMRARMMRTPNLLFIACTSSVLFVAITPLVVRWCEIDPFLAIFDWESGLRFVAFLFFLVLPFFTGALVIGYSFIRFPEFIGKFYFSNLLGSAAGIMGAVVLLEFVSPDRLPLLLALIGVLSVWEIVGGSRLHSVLALGLTGVVCGLLLLPSPGMPLSEYKDLARALLLPETVVTDRKTSPLGVIETIQGPSLRYAPGLSLSYAGSVPTDKAVFHDGQWLGPLIPPDRKETWEIIEHSASFLPYRLAIPGRVLILGAGTGVDLLTAWHYGADAVLGVEMNPAVVDLFSTTYGGMFHARSQGSTVRMIAEDARAVVATDTSHYNLVIVSALGGHSANAAGTQAQFENYLITKESLLLMLARLEPRGLLFFQTWMESPPRSSAKILSTIFNALTAAGITSPEEHVAVIRSWNTAAVMVSREVLGERQVREVRRFSREMNFDLAWIPGLAEGETNRFHGLERPYLFDYVRAFTAGREKEFYRAYPFFVEPSTDDRPYFSNFVSWPKFPRLLEAYGAGQIPFVELGTFFLAWTVAVVALLSLVLIAVPVGALTMSGTSRTSWVPTMIYFAGLGIGYMVVEMVVIQKAVLFLGDPLYSVAAGVGSLLLFSSIGSACSVRLRSKLRHRLWAIPIGIILLLLLYAIALSPILSLLLSISLWKRFLVLSLVVGPLAFALGIPFPLGLSAVAKKSPAIVPLAWGVNGYCSVVAASSAVLVSIEFGFQVLQALGIGAYVMAFVALGWITRRGSGGEGG